MLNFLLEEAAGGTGGFNPMSLIIIVVLFAALYFLMIRPEKKREKAAQEMRSALQVGDEVTTIGGIIGKVVSIKEGTFVLETTRDRTRIRFLVSAIRNVDVKAEDAAAPRTRATGNEKPAVEETVEVVAEDEVTTEETTASETATNTEDETNA
jgi:preprotein translocase subunit YajC